MDRLISNAERMCKSANSDIFKILWFNIYKTLVIKYKGETEWKRRLQ